MKMMVNHLITVQRYEIKLTYASFYAIIFKNLSLLYSYYKKIFLEFLKKLFVIARMVQPKHHPPLFFNFGATPRRFCH